MCEVETFINNRPVKNIINDIIFISKNTLQYSDKEEQIETLIEDNKYEEVIDKLTQKITFLENGIKQILQIVDIEKL